MDLSALNADSLAMVLQDNHERWKHEETFVFTIKVALPVSDRASSNALSKKIQRKQTALVVIDD